MLASVSKIETLGVRLQTKITAAGPDSEADDAASEGRVCDLLDQGLAVVRGFSDLDAANQVQQASAGEGLSRRREHNGGNKPTAQAEAGVAQSSYDRQHHRVASIARNQFQRKFGHAGLGSGISIVPPMKSNTDWPASDPIMIKKYHRPSFIPVPPRVSQKSPPDAASTQTPTLVMPRRRRRPAKAVCSGVIVKENRS